MSNYMLAIAKTIAFEYLKEIIEYGEMARWLTTRTARVEEPSSGPNTHIRRLTPHTIPPPGDPLPPVSLVGTHPHTDTRLHN